MTPFLETIKDQIEDLIERSILLSSRLEDSKRPLLTGIIDLSKTTGIR